MTSGHGEWPWLAKRFTVLGSILLFFACLGMGGAALIRVQRGEIVTGWAIAAGAVAGAFSTAGYWRSVLPGIFGIAALNSFVALLSGHQLTRGTVPVPRAVSGICVVLFLTAAVLSKRFVKSKITVADRFFMLGAITSLFVGLTNDTLAIPAASAMLCFVGASWMFARLGILSQQRN